MPDHETATWGDVCSTACQISFLERSRSLYETIFWKLRGRLAPHVVCLLLSVHLVWHGILWDSMIF
ncbi:MAG: hypothetical protein ACJA1F_002203 [Paracoccaceae bacterium]|jgi:hypothetical protein